MKEECLICKAPLEYLEEGVLMELGEILCSHSGSNNQCIGKRCPFNKGRE